MVYQDISNHESKPVTDLQPFKYKASLMDRFFSFLIDYLIFSPFVSFILFIFFQDAIRYWRQSPEAAEQVSITLLLAFSYIIIFSLFQALFITFNKATPGQYFLKMQIVFETSNSFIFWRAFCRQVGFWFSILFMGLPWLALLSHPLQKTFYDRLTDCRVLSKKKDSAYFGFEVENRFWQSFTATMMIFVGMIFFSVFVMKYNEVTQRTDSFHVFEKKNHFCSELKNVSQSSRLQLAIAMNLVGQLSDDCLDRESDFVLWKDKVDEFGLAYFAKSLTEENTETEQVYLKEACQQKTDNMGCHLAKAFQTADFETLYVYLKEKKSVLAQTLTYELSAILDKPEDRSTYFEKLADFDDQKLIKKYLLSEIVSQKKDSTNRLPASVEDEGLLEEQALQLIKDL